MPFLPSPLLKILLAYSSLYKRVKNDIYTTYIFSRAEEGPKICFLEFTLCTCCPTYCSKRPRDGFLIINLMKYDEKEKESFEMISKEYRLQNGKKVLFQITRNGQHRIKEKYWPNGKLYARRWYVSPEHIRPSRTVKLWREDGSLFKMGKVKEGTIHGKV